MDSFRNKCLKSEFPNTPKAFSKQIIDPPPPPAAELKLCLLKHCIDPQWPTCRGPEANFKLITLCVCVAFMVSQSVSVYICICVHLCKEVPDWLAACAMQGSVKHVVPNQAVCSFLQTPP